MSNTPNLDLEAINILSDTEHAYKQIVQEIINKVNANNTKIDNSFNGNDNVDGGYFKEQQPLSYHIKDINAHQNIFFDGNDNSIPNTNVTIQEHVIDPNTHSNMNVDGGSV